MGPAVLSSLIGIALLIGVVLLIWALSPPDGDAQDDDAGGGGGGPPRRPLPRPRGPHDALRPPAPDRVRMPVSAHRRRLPARDTLEHR